MTGQHHQRQPSGRSGTSRLLHRGTTRLVATWRHLARVLSRRDKVDKPGKSDQSTVKSDQSTVKRVTGLGDFAQIQSPVTAIFIHYHPREYVAPGFTRLVKSAVGSGFRVMFVSTSRPSRILPQLEDYHGLAYVHRENHGYDFGALKDARDTLEQHALLADGRYVVLNSSMLNIASPGFGSDPILDQLSCPTEETDLLGITASYEENVYHIQTYFYSCSAKFFRSAQCARFLEKYQNGLSKTKLSARDYAIQAGELSLSPVAIKAGYSVRAIFDDLCLPTRKCYEEIEALSKLVFALLPSLQSPALLSHRSSASNPLYFQVEWLPRVGLQSNPSQSCWSLLLYRDFLFLKRELLEFSNAQEHHAPSVVALLMPVLEACEVNLPDWSDLRALPQLVHSSKVNDDRDIQCK